MDPSGNREELMHRDVLLVATVGGSLLNGLHFSPYVDHVHIMLKPFLAGTALSSPTVVLYLASIFCSFLTLMFAGIPAAIYERWKGLQQSSTASLAIWFAGTTALAVPSVLSAAASR